MCNFSLRSRPIGPSNFFGLRRKVALRCEDYAWAPILGSLDKLREVGVLSHLLYPLFNCFVMLELILGCEWPFDRSQKLGTEV